MKQFAVWAPIPEQVRLVVDGHGTFNMQRTKDGWWTCTEISPQVGMRYGYQLLNDGSWSPTFPDPRTTSQPEGIHGLSEVTSTAYQWNDEKWQGLDLADMVIYELHVGTFSPSGDFAGVIEKLDYLADLGVNAIELMPVQPFGGERNWGYDGVDWLAVHAAYGGRTGLKDLVNAAHERGMAIVLDTVYNHFGPDGNYNGLYGPYTTAGATAWGDVVNFSEDSSDEVRAYVLDSVKQWLDEFHIDALRLDAIHSFDDRGAYSIMEEMQFIADEISAATGVPRSLIAESDLNDPRLINPSSVGGYGLAGQWVDDIHHGLHTIVSGENHAYYDDFGTIEVLADTLKKGWYFTHLYSTYRGRTHGRALDPKVVSPAQLVTYTTTHDQTGNRAAGDRPSQNLTATQQVLKAAFIYCSPFTPMLFMGEEFGAQTPFPFFCSHTNDELNRLTREGRMHEFSRSGWDAADVPDPSAESTFDSARLVWSFSPEQESILAAYKELLRLRRELRLAQPSLEDFQVEHSDTWLTYSAGQSGEYTLAVNFSNTETIVPVGGELVYSFSEVSVGEEETTLGPWEFALIKP